MKSKVIGILVIMLLFSTVLFPVLSTIEIEKPIEKDITINLNYFEKTGDRDWAFCWINDYIDASDLTKCDNEKNYITDRLDDKGNYHEYHVCNNYDSASHWNHDWESGYIDPADIAIFLGHGASGSDGWYDETLKLF